MLAAADASPKLVQLADAEPVGIHHHHHRRIRHVHADLDDGGTHQDIDLARAERRHHGVLLVAGQPTVHQAQAQSGQRPVAQLFEERHHRGSRRTLIVLGGLVALIDARCHDIRLATGTDFFDDALPGPLQPRRLLLDEDRVGGDGLATAREFAQRRRFEVAVDGERDGARNRRRRHHQQVRRQSVGCLGAQPVSLLDTEPVLFVDDDHAEPLELHRLLQQRVRADDDARIAGSRLRRAPPASVEATWTRSAVRRASRRSAPPSCPAIASGPRTSRMDRACWAARTSVGASSAHWYPASTICNMASTETMVLPEPTSPCSMRFMGRLADSSADSTSSTSLWPSVNSNGNCSRIAVKRPSFSGRAAGPDSLSSPYRRPTNAHCSPTASSNVSRRLGALAFGRVLREVDRA